MPFSVYHIQHIELRKSVKYILFNQFNSPETKKLICYANNNVCLGIVKENSLIKEHDGEFSFKKTSNLSSYITGVYTRPHIVDIRGGLDEICIDFSLHGYNNFFPFPLSTYLLGENILKEVFGTPAEMFFYTVFEEQDVFKRGGMIENFLLSKNFGS